MTISNTNLISLREFFSHQQILICFNGPISTNLIGEIGSALKDHIESNDATELEVMDVFSVYIEMSQNIRNYATIRGFSESESSATVVIAAAEAGHYAVCAGNVVAMEDGQVLLKRIQELAACDKAELKLLYKQQLRQPHSRTPGQGAGLGLIEIARRSSQPMEASLDPLETGRAFFSLRAII
ncbi:biofilm regulation protein kinase SiaB [Synechococcus sp. BA-132 BA5]|uniref:biofilm regulation protein kinase SiaB n=1 Tax=Synechococcus sp. BA-132 BA5 TaxID=3110252 RepID=UPI002B21DBE3|nr:biofilm regulation protein kinase SiaB [Synechococcus sp. BA-132 BA5]MEA5416582.1 biofilm regulation protein kinase SiaB [Synechococcus sp. BA-132 BA5]